jgi:4-amino-4-deoxy-L-arabinose transferase-like glycosyltransferase
MALTPAAVLMFRFDNPDALMVLLVTAAAYCIVRALERGGTGGGQGGFSQITTWVEAHYKSATIGGQTVYLLLQPKS